MIDRVQDLLFFFDIAMQFRTVRFPDANPIKGHHRVCRCISFLPLHARLMRDALRQYSLDETNHEMITDPKQLTKNYLKVRPGLVAAQTLPFATTHVSQNENSITAVRGRGGSCWT